jgi:hypothetical protein
MSVDAAVRYLIEVEGVDPHSVTPARIIDRILEKTGKSAVNAGYVGNLLSKARQNAPNNGGMRVR